MKFFLKVGNNVYGWASKRAAEAWAKANGVPRNKITTTKPQGSKPKAAPKPVPTRNNKGNFTKPRPVTKPKTTTVGNKPQAPSVPARPKVDKAPANQPKTRAVATKNNPKTKNTMKDITPPTRAISGSSKPKPPKPTTRPNAKSAAAGALRLSTTVGSAPTLDTTAPTAKTKPNNKSGEMPKKKKKEDPKRKTSPKPKLRPKKKVDKRATSPKPKLDPLKGWSEPRRKALKSKKIGQDAGDGFVWIVMGNSNGLTRVRPNDPRVAEQKKLQKLLK